MPLLDRSNLIHALLMPAARKRSFEPDSHDFTRYFWRNQTRSE
jgi:hypothetical protein